MAWTLLVAVSTDATDEALRTLRREAIKAVVICMVEAGSGVYLRRNRGSR